MTEQEAIERAQQNDRALLAERERLLRLDTAERKALCRPGEERGAAEPERIGAVVTEKLLKSIPEEFDREKPESIRAKDQAKLDRTDWKKVRFERALERLPPAMQKLVKTEGALQKTEAVQLVEAWEESNRYRVLVLRGGVGAGKTTAAAAAVAMCARRGEPSISWHRPHDFISAVLHAYDAKAPKLGTDLVVVDDMGRETRDEFGEALSAFLDDTETRLILTTNLTTEQFQKRYDVRLRDRLRGCAISVVVHGDSRRQGGWGFE